MAIFSFNARARTADLVRCICLAISAILAPENASFRSLSSSSGDHGTDFISLASAPQIVNAAGRLLSKLKLRASKGGLAEGVTRLFVVVNGGLRYR
jgi:hypothetical protein